MKMMKVNVYDCFVYDCFVQLSLMCVTVPLVCTFK